MERLVHGALFVTAQFCHEYSSLSSSSSIFPLGRPAAFLAFVEPSATRWLTLLSRCWCTAPRLGICSVFRVHLTTSVVQCCPTCGISCTCISTRTASTSRSRTGTTTSRRWIGTWTVECWIIGIHLIATVVCSGFICGSRHYKAGWWQVWFYDFEDLRGGIKIIFCSYQKPHL